MWLGFFGVILVLALLAGFAFLRGGRQLAELQVQHQAEPVQQLLYVILNGEQRVVPEAKRLQLSLDMQFAVDEEQGKLLERMRQQIDAAVDTAFAPCTTMWVILPTGTIRSRENTCVMPMLLAVTWGNTCSND